MNVHCVQAAAWPPVKLRGMRPEADCQLAKLAAFVLEHCSIQMHPKKLKQKRIQEPGAILGAVHIEHHKNANTHKKHLKTKMEFIRNNFFLIQIDPKSHAYSIANVP